MRGGGISRAADAVLRIKRRVSPLAAAVALCGDRSASIYRCPPPRRCCHLTLEAKKGGLANSGLPDTRFREKPPGNLGGMSPAAEPAVCESPLPRNTRTAPCTHAIALPVRRPMPIRSCLADGVCCFQGGESGAAAAVKQVVGRVQAMPGGAATACHGRPDFPAASAMF